VADKFFEAEIEDRQVSFNRQRSYFDPKKKHRKVVLQKSPLLTKTFATPGVLEKKERKLLKDIKAKHNLANIKKYSWEAENVLFSLMWRFGLNEDSAGKFVSALKPVEGKTRKLIERVNKKHRQAIVGIGLKPGTIYLLPDREVLFNRPDRVPKPYSRKVLLAVVDSSQLIFIPMSSKTKWINEEKDILFDSDCEVEALSLVSRPAIENFPYKHFDRPIVLFVSAAQPMLKDDFVQAALIPLGRVRNKVLECIKEKMKKN